jgi:hypothetical protein
VFLGDTGPLRQRSKISDASMGTSAFIKIVKEGGQFIGDTLIEGWSYKDVWQNPDEYLKIIGCHAMVIPSYTKPAAHAIVWSRYDKLNRTWEVW